MPKAKPHPGQLGFLFEVPVPASCPAALAGGNAGPCKPACKPARKQALAEPRRAA